MNFYFRPEYIMQDKLFFFGYVISMIIIIIIALILAFKKAGK